MVTNSVKERGGGGIYNENNRVAPGADGEGIFLIIGSIKVLLKCNSLSDKPRHCPFALLLVMVI